MEWEHCFRRTRGVSSALLMVTFPRLFSIANTQEVKVGSVVGIRRSRWYVAVFLA
jgi:hypothetical protein